VRLRNARYLGELTKFRLVPFGTTFSLLKSLLDDFVGHNVDAAAALVETAGRFLYRLPETQMRMTNMLEVAPPSTHPCKLVRASGTARRTCGRMTQLGERW
jgi:hypothetical protein